MKIEFKLGDLASIDDVDALVNPARTDLRLLAGVGGRLRAVGGSAVEDDLRGRAPLALGAVAVGAGGELVAPRVLHAAVVSFEPADLMAPREGGALVHGTVLRNAMREILRVAAALALRSLAVADLTGPSLFPVELGARIVLSELHELLEQPTPPTLERVVFVAALDSHRRAYEHAWNTLQKVYAERASAPPPGETDAEAT